MVVSSDGWFDSVLGDSDGIEDTIVGADPSTAVAATAETLFLSMMATAMRPRKRNGVSCMFLALVAALVDRCGCESVRSSLVVRKKSEADPRFGAGFLRA